ncbi:hypothetical protein [Nonomuraea jabiensis]|uniref:hypothetical protein n=1 Tax=Nonomuraea jabiensis TaxID=882448 RepID=UPI003D7570BF
MTAKSTPSHRLSIKWRQHSWPTSCCPGYAAVALVLGGWYVDLLKATLVLPPCAALLFACFCLFSRTEMVGWQFRVQVLAFSVVVIVWIVALKSLRYVEDVASF